MPAIPNKIILYVNVIYDIRLSIKCQHSAQNNLPLVPKGIAMLAMYNNLRDGRAYSYSNPARSAISINSLEDARRGS